MRKFLSTFKEEVYEPANALGKGDYDKVIEIHQKFLENKEQKNSLASLTSIAQCYDWKGDTENGYDYAIKALELDPNDFDMLVIVAKYWFKQQDDKKTYEFVEKILKSEPPKLSKPPIVVVIIFKLLSLFSKKYKHCAKELSSSGSKVNNRIAEIQKWATQYKAWYETKENETS